MENYLQFLENAKKYAFTAEHLLTETYPVVKDPRMLLSVLQNAFSAYKSCMMFMLYRDVAMKKIPPFENDFQAMFALFKARAERRYSISGDYIRIIEEISAILKEHKASPMEFSRHEMYIICSDNYKMKTITTQQLREYISKAKLFIDEIDTGNAKHERVS